MKAAVLPDIEDNPLGLGRQLPARVQEHSPYTARYGGQGEGQALTLNEQKAKIILDIANKKRNTARCFEVGYVSSSLPIGAAFSDSAPPRFINLSRSLS
jgi:hypothetical protein